MKSTMKALLFVAGFAVLFAGCGGGSSGPSSPYADIVVDPDSSVNGVDYYTYPVKYIGATLTLQFSTLNGVWNLRLSSIDHWQQVDTRIRLWTAANYSSNAANDYLEEMGFETLDWDYNTTPATYTILLKEPAATALSADVPLLAIIEGYLLRPDIFGGAVPLPLSD